MERRLIIASVLGCLLVPLFSANLPGIPKIQKVTSAPSGPFTVVGHRLMDSDGQPFLMRGTQLQPFRLANVGDDNRAGDVFGAHSATSLSAVRLRFNMNTVRLPVDSAEADMPGFWTELGKVIKRANELDLLVVLAAEGNDAFWNRAGREFRDRPNVVFATGDSRFVAPLREAGALQPIAIRTGVASGNVLREVSPRWSESLELPPGAAMVNGLDLELNNAAACRQVPADPAAAWQMVQRRLQEFDASEISWTISEFVPGKLIKDLAYHDASTLEDGWTCGEETRSGTGMGRAVEGYLRATQERELFVVSGAGGVVVARGAFALAYGPVMANRDSQNTAVVPSSRLGGIRVEITDAAGVTRPAGMLWASAGWGQTNFVVPQESAVGPATMQIVRDDGSRAQTNLTIADTAPGFLTGHSCRGPAIGTIVRRTASGRESESPLSSCNGAHCETHSVSLAPGTKTLLRLDVSGVRNTKAKDQITVTIDGENAPVLAYGGSGKQGKDFLTVEVPQSLRGRGEVDLIARVNGRLSNSVRVRIG